MRTTDSPALTARQRLALAAWMLTPLLLAVALGLAALSAHGHAPQTPPPTGPVIVVNA